MPFGAFKPRKRKCKVCSADYMAQRQMQNVCSGLCALKLVERQKTKAAAEKTKRERRESREAKQRLKTKGDHLREAQAAFNAYIRERDKGLPCISCGSLPNNGDLLTGSRIDAGHYRSTGSCPELRFEPLNCHAQCVKCNRNLSGNAVEYRIRLIERIGAASVDWLEGPHEAKRYTIEDLKDIKAKYRAMTRELKRAIEKTTAGGAGTWRSVTRKSC
jgi:hypothetical protein